MPTKLTNYERETIINFNEGADTASLYTHSPKLRRRLEQLARERPEECRLYQVTHWNEAVEYYVPKSWLKIHPPRILSEEQRAAWAEIARRAFSGQDTPSVDRDGTPIEAETGKDTTQPMDVENFADSPVVFGEEAHT